MSFFSELILPADELYRETGRMPTRILVPRWRTIELIACAAEMPLIVQTPPPAIDCDFMVGGFFGFWWDRDYIEYRL